MHLTDEEIRMVNLAVRSLRLREATLYDSVTWAALQLRLDVEVLRIARERRQSGKAE